MDEPIRVAPVHADPLAAYVAMAKAIGVTFEGNTLSKDRYVAAMIQVASSACQDPTLDPSLARPLVERIIRETALVCFCEERSGGLDGIWCPPHGPSPAEAA